MATPIVPPSCLAVLISAIHKDIRWLQFEVFLSTFAIYSSFLCCGIYILSKGSTVASQLARDGLQIIGLLVRLPLINYN